MNIEIFEKIKIIHDEVQNHPVIPPGKEKHIWASHRAEIFHILWQTTKSLECEPITFTEEEEWAVQQPHDPFIITSQIDNKPLINIFFHPSN